MAKTQGEDEDSTKLHKKSTTENGYKDRNKLSLKEKADIIL